MQKIIYIPVDTNINNTVECNKLIKRGDTLTLQIKVFTNAVLADLTGQSIDLILKKSNGTLIEKVIDTSNVVNGVITAMPGQQSTLVEGVVSGEVQIYTNDTLTSTNTFTYIVDDSLADDILEVSKDDIQVLADLRNLINNGEVTLQEYKDNILAIANSIEAIEALANIKLYIDTNLPMLESENAKSVVNIVNEKVENDRADINIVTLGELNNNAEILEQLLITLTSENTKASGNIPALNDENTNAQSNIEALTTKNSTATNNINTLETTIINAETKKQEVITECGVADDKIAAMQAFGDVTQVSQNIAALETEVETARGTEANLDARLDKNDVSVANLITQTSENTQDIQTINSNIAITPTANKLLKLDSNSKLPASITGDADSVDGVQGNQIPLKTTTDITYYVATTGSDTTGDGTSGNPFKTIQYAINKLPQIINHTVIINVTSGTYTENVVISGFTGKGNISIIGATTQANSVNYVFNGNITLADCDLFITIQGLKICNVATQTRAILVDRCQYVFIYICKLDGTNRQGLVGNIGVASSVSNVQVCSCDISNYSSTSYGYCIDGITLATIYSNANSGTNNNIGLISQGGSTISKYGSQPTATTAESLVSGGAIR